MALPVVFISYRRDDSAGHAGRLYDRLAARVGDERVWRDVDDVGAGDDYLEAIRKRIGQCDVVLVLIGPRWLSATDEQGRSRLADEQDVLRHEITTALERKLRVIPVLLQDTRMPRAQDLPAPLAKLALLNAFEIRETQFDADADQLIDMLTPRPLDRARGIVTQRPVLAALAALTLIAVAGVVIVTGRTMSPEAARMRLDQMGIDYSVQSFYDEAGRDDAGTANVVRLFLQAGMSPDAALDTMVWGTSALAAAAGTGRRETVQAILDAKPGAGTLGDAIRSAAGEGHGNIVELLLEAGAPPTSDVLMAAAGDGNTRLVGELLDRGADVNGNGGAALTRAAANGKLETMDLLFSRGADVDAKDDEGWTALHFDAVNSNADSAEQLAVVRKLIEHKATIDARDSRYEGKPGWTPLMHAVSSGHPKLARLLIEAGADVNAIGYSDNVYTGRSVLMLAVQEGLTDIIPLLLTRGADINARNNEGRTALMLAAIDGADDIVRLLLDAGSDVTLTDVQGKTAAMLASERRHSSTAALLTKT
jgi:ankyrin repeat protein